MPSTHHQHHCHNLCPSNRQVLDARDPAACRCEDVERYIRSTSPNKRIILLLNKMGERC
jgi:ribosome biogenesis GTPase A